MSYFRLVLIPVYLVVYFSAETDEGLCRAAAVIAVSGLTDMLDGKIARHFNMITDWGKLIDPVADKFTFIAAIALSMSFSYPLMGVMFGVYVVKELYMFCMGAYMLRRGFHMDGPVVRQSLHRRDLRRGIPPAGHPGMPEQVSDALIGICLAATVFAFVGYVAFYARAWRSLSK